MWSFAAGTLWRSGRESGNTPAQKWSPEFKNHPPRDWRAAGPGRLGPTSAITKDLTFSSLFFIQHLYFFLEKCS